LRIARCPEAPRVDSDVAEEDGRRAGVERFCKSKRCGKPLTGRQRNFCSRKCGWNHRDDQKPRKWTEEQLRVPQSCSFCSGFVPIERLRYALGKGQHLFCSEDCRAAFWNKENNEKHLLEVYGTLTPQAEHCKYPPCQNLFVAKRNSSRRRRLYCQELCAKRDRGRRKKIKKYGPTGKPAPVRCAYVYCGKLLPRKRDGHNQRIYCNSKCRRRDLMILEHPNCDICEKPIDRKKLPTATTCSKTCKREKANLMRELGRERRSSRERPEV
jgi:hypothetical protein